MLKARFVSYAKTNLKWISNLNTNIIRTKTLKIFKEDTQINLHDTGFAMHFFLTRHQKHEQQWNNFIKATGNQT